MIELLLDTHQELLCYFATFCFCLASCQFCSVHCIVFITFVRKVRSSCHCVFLFCPIAISTTACNYLAVFFIFLILLFYYNAMFYCSWCSRYPFYVLAEMLGWNICRDADHKASPNLHVFKSQMYYFVNIVIDVATSTCLRAFIISILAQQPFFKGHYSRNNWMTLCLRLCKSGTLGLVKVRELASLTEISVCWDKVVPKVFVCANLEP